MDGSDSSATTSPSETPKRRRPPPPPPPVSRRDRDKERDSESNPAKSPDERGAAPPLPLRPAPTVMTSSTDDTVGHARAPVVPPRPVASSGSQGSMGGGASTSMGQGASGSMSSTTGFASLPRSAALPVTPTRTSMVPMSPQIASQSQLFKYSVAANMNRDLPQHQMAPSGLSHDHVHKGSLRCLAVNGLLAVTVGEKHLRVYALNSNGKELGAFSFASGSSSQLNSMGGSTSSLSLDRHSTTSSANSNSNDQFKASAVCFVPTQSIHDSSNQVWLAIEKTGELLSLDISQLPSAFPISDRRTAHASTITHILNATHPLFPESPEMWTLDDQGGLRVWNSGNSGQDGVISLSRGLARTLRVAKSQSVAHVVCPAASSGSAGARFLWTAGGKTLEVHEPNKDSPQGVFRTRVDVTGTAGNFVCLAGGSCADGAPVYSGHDDGKVVVWESGTYVKRYIVSTGIYKVTSLCVPAGRSRGLWCGFGTGRISIFDTTVWDSWVLVREFGAHSVGGGVVGSAGAAVAGNSAVVGCMIADTKALATTGNLYVISCAMEIGQLKVWDGFLTKDWKDTYTKDREELYSSYRDMSVFVGSWNINASKPDALDSLPRGDQVFHQWFQPSPSNQTLPQPPSIIAIGFQELVDLESKKANAKQMLIQAVGAKNSKSGENRMAAWKEKIVSVLRECFPSENYRLLECHQLFGLFQCVFMREEEYYRCKPGSISVSQVKTGMGGLHGNKGGIGLRIVLDDSSFCFVNCHMAAHQSHVSARNQDVLSIRDQISFAPMRQLDGVFAQAGDGSLVLDHENIFFSGDLNYRIDMDRDRVMSHIKMQNWGELLAKDQLTDQFTANAQFGLRGFSEGRIQFAPTFKYDLNSTTYDTSEKKRVPAWCDRILWKGRHITQLDYSRAECNISDHRPVSSTFRVRVKAIDFDALERVRALAVTASNEHFGNVAAEVLRGKGALS
ncbi:Endonuclease/exonuclease/phosphatase [Chytriomyces cf. hyalinus JEL632]|nr:Endonuclease/exonuclease/phosphatase [Chytriomyces cf. hyalinus JEL632]